MEEEGGLRDVDAVLTTRELGRLIRRSGINFAKLPDEDFDNDIVHDYTGAGVIFGVTGGVMEAALRTAYYVLTGKEREGIVFNEVRGFENIREAEFDLAGAKIRIAVTSGMKGAKVLLDQIRAGKSPYTFIEIMGCPGGCINGGGQSIVPSKIKNGKLGYGYKELRMKALYDEDVLSELRVSSDNPQIQQLYADFLEKPGSELAEKLLHTSYSPKEKFNIV
jgi:NADP-reducing hydrogenase subunit HndD